MGAHPWFYFVAYQPDTAQALQDLRCREFEAGRYYPIVQFLRFPVNDSVRPGSGHNSIDQALAVAGPTGTRSVLDMQRISPDREFGAVTQLGTDTLQELYGTPCPDRAAVERNMDFFEDLDRGEGIWFVVYEKERPSEIFFVGYSYD